MTDSVEKRQSEVLGRVSLSFCPSGDTVVWVSDRRGSTSPYDFPYVSAQLMCLSSDGLVQKRFDILSKLKTLITATHCSLARSSHARHVRLEIGRMRESRFCHWTLATGYSDLFSRARFENAVFLAKVQQCGKLWTRRGVFERSSPPAVSRSRRQHEKRKSAFSVGSKSASDYGHYHPIYPACHRVIRLYQIYRSCE